MTRKAHITEVKAFAAFDLRGNLLYGTIRAEKADAAAALERFNPRSDGVPYYWRVLPIYIGHDLNFQHSFDLPA